MKGGKYFAGRGQKYCEETKTIFRKNILGRYVKEEVGNSYGPVRENIVVPTFDNTDSV